MLAVGAAGLLATGAAIAAVGFGDGGSSRLELRGPALQVTGRPPLVLPEIADGASSVVPLPSIDLPVPPTSTSSPATISTIGAATTPSLARDPLAPSPRPTPQTLAESVVTAPPATAPPVVVPVTVAEAPTTTTTTTAPATAVTPSTSITTTSTTTTATVEAGQLRTFDATLGSVTVRYGGGRVALIDTEPAAGAKVAVADSGPTRVIVRFDSGRRRETLRITLDRNGQPTLTIQGD